MNTTKQLDMRHTTKQPLNNMFSGRPAGFFLTKISVFMCKDYSFFFIMFLRLRIIIVLLLIIITIKKSRAGGARVSQPPCNRVPEEWGRELGGEKKMWARVLLVPFHDATCAWLIKTES